MLHANAPSLSLGIAAQGSHLSADVHQIAAAAQPVKQRHHSVHSMALADGGKVQSQGRRTFAQRRRLQSRLQPGVAHPRQGCLDFRRSRQTRPGLRTEPPKIDQGRDRQIERTGGLPGKRQALGDDLRQGAGNRHPLVCRPGIEAGDDRVQPPRGRLRLHPLQLLRHARPNFALTAAVGDIDSGAEGVALMAAELPRSAAGGAKQQPSQPQQYLGLHARGAAKHAARPATKIRVKAGCGNEAAHRGRAFDTTTRGENPCPNTAK